MDKKKLETYRNEYIFLRKKIFDDINQYLSDKRISGVAHRIGISESWLAECRLHSKKCTIQKMFDVYESILQIGK